MADTKQFTILAIDDEIEVLNSLKRFFIKAPYRLLLAENGERGLEMLSKEEVSLILLDLKMPGMDGMTVLQKAKSLCPELKVIIQTGHGGIDEAVEAVKKGASDFLVKGDSPEILRIRVAAVYEQWRLFQENRRLQESGQVTFDFAPLLGVSPAMQKLKELILRIGAAEVTVLVQGESGTGKELIAQAIHHHSRRRHKPFVVVDCGSLSETVIESELFGHEKGAYTGAETATKGLVREADGGTLFLDEIGELSIGVQAKLLRVIQEKTVRPVGSTKTHPVDIRILAATNRNLLDEVARNAFRQDLYYRLSMVTLTSPPLRERAGDIDLLADRILQQARDTQGILAELPENSRQLLRRYDWPGNVRELENAILSSLVFAEKGVIQPQDLPEAIGAGQIAESVDGASGTLAVYEQEAIKNALLEARNNRSMAARILGISEATLYRKIKLYGL